MTRPHLFGPVSAEFAREYLAPLQTSGAIRSFGFEPGVDFQISFENSWRDLAARCQQVSWSPQFLALWLPYDIIPPDFWNAPIPIVGLATDWNLLWHLYQHVAPLCDLFLTDPFGSTKFAQAGVDRVCPVNLSCLGQSFLDYPWATPQADRDIDILFVSNLHPAGDRNCIPWLGRLASLADRWHISIHSEVSRADYRKLLTRAKLVFTPSSPDRCQNQSLEAALAGCLVVQERSDFPGLLLTGAEVATFDVHDFEQTIRGLLTSDPERIRIATAAQRRAREFHFASQWAAAVAGIELDWDQLHARAQSRQPVSAAVQLQTRILTSLSTIPPGRDTRLREHLAKAPDLTEWEVANAQGVAAAMAGRPAGEVADCFRPSSSSSAIASLNLAEVLASQGDNVGALPAARTSLAARAITAESDPVFVPPGFHSFRVEWERAAWMHASDPQRICAAKTALIQSQAHGIIASLTGKLDDYRQAASSGVFPKAMAAYGCALARAGQFTDAVGPLRQAVDADPLDRRSARTLHRVLEDAGEFETAQLFADERRLLARAAPVLIPAESWFAESKIRSLGQQDFAAKYGNPNTAHALVRSTNVADTHAILTLLQSCQPAQVVEIGTHFGMMTANLTEWTADETVIFSLGALYEPPQDQARAQPCTSPPPIHTGSFADYFAKAYKIRFIYADSRYFDFRRLGTVGFALVSGEDDFERFLNDTRQAYQTLGPGGCLCWHGLGNRSRNTLTRVISGAGLIEPIQIVAETGVAFLHKAGHRQNPSVRLPALRLTWQGEQAEVNSLARVNRALVERLRHRGRQVLLREPNRIESGSPGTDPVRSRPDHQPESPSTKNVVIRQSWPPDFSPTDDQRLVLILPWEFGSLPREWARALNSGAIDQVWVPTQYVQDCFLRSGVPEELLRVVPYGVDVSRFRRGLEPYPLSTQRRFRFLYVGGTIWRKGFDVLLDAYGRAFAANDDVCLVVKDMGVGTFYRDQTAEQQIATFRSNPHAPEIEYLVDELSESDLARLYAACHCLAQPYRGEGFCLPIAEAMACGLPAIVTNHGAALDWCNATNAYLIPAKEVRFRERRVGNLETVDLPWAAEPDVDALTRLLQHVVAHPGEAAARGREGCAAVRGRLTWDHAASIAERSLRQLEATPTRQQTSFAHPLQASKPKVSLTMIVRNEEHHLGDCLRSVHDLVDEIIIVDTGSTDRTKEIARAFTARVFDFPWVDNFAAARNAALKEATGTWIFWMDADDRLDDSNRTRLKKLFDQLGSENAAYALKCRCIGNGNTTATVVDHLRVFRNRPDVRWRYRVHEQILGAARDSGAKVLATDVVVTHVGYVDNLARRRKLDRDMRLLLLENQECPDDPFTLFNLGSVTNELGQTLEAIPLFQRSIERSHPLDSIVRKLYALKANCFRQLGRPLDALKECELGRRHYPNDAELLYIEAGLRRSIGDEGRAEACLRLLLDGTDAVHFASIGEGLRGYKGRHLLARLLLDTGRAAEARVEWRRAVDENPSFMPAQIALAELLLDEKCWSELESLTCTLRQLGAYGVEAAAEFDARAHMDRGQPGPAYQELRKSLELVPESFRLHLLCSHAALQAGLQAEAEAALLAVLELDADHAESRHNLAVLRRKLQAGGEGPKPRETLP